MINKDFITAGKAIFTIEIPLQHRKDVAHYTFKVSKVENDKGTVFFVKVLTGPDNSLDYTYLGMLLPQNGEIKITKKSKYSDNSYVVRLLSRTIKALWQDREADILAAGFDIHHEGRCGRCGRKLTVPESVKTGLGPECAGRI